MINKKKLFSYILLALVGFCIIYLCSLFVLNPAIDTGRELYIPLRILKGEVLYKDIFNIYGALSYQINAIAYLLLGAKINSLRILGTINFMLIISAVWFILKELFNTKVSIFSKMDLNNKENPFSICFLTFLNIAYLSNGIFNYILPYAFAMTYGICFFLISLLFFIKFSKNNTPKFAYIASLFAGGAIACKYEFTGYIIFLLTFIIFCKNISKKNVLISILSFTIIPCISYGILFFQGMTFEDLIKTYKILKTMASTQAIQYLYSNFTGTYFNLKVFTICLYKTLIITAIGAISFFSNKFYNQDKFLKFIVLAFFILGILYTGSAGFSLLAMINAILFFIFIKQIYKNKPIFIYMLSTILLSLKTFFAVNIETYGAYTLPFIIISLFTFLFHINYSNKETLKSNIKNIFSVIVIGMLGLIFIQSGIRTLKLITGYIYTAPIKSGNYFKILTNTIYTYPYIAKPINNAIKYIEEKTKPSDKIVVLPETQFLNFVTGRPADNLYDSLTPMYFETFGENNIIKHFSETKPEYFIINNRDTSDYGKRYICDDYGIQFCSFVKDNYERVAIFGEKQYILQVFKRKDLI